MKSKSDWARIIKAWESSGLSQSEYCRRIGVRDNQFCYHRKKLGKDVSGGKFLAVVTGEETEITFGGGIKVKVSAHTSVNFLRKLAEAYGC